MFDQAAGKVTWPLITMVLACRESTWPEGSIDLRGLPW